MVTFPRDGFVLIDTLAIFKLLSELPEWSFAKTLIVIGVLTLVVALSLLTIGLLVATAGSNTVISTGVTGQFEVSPAAHKGT